MANKNIKNNFMDNKINELLNRLSSIPVKEWVTGIGYTTTINGVSVEIKGESEFGLRYYIKLDNELIYKYEDPIFSFKKNMINRKLDIICDGIDLYLYKTHELKILSKIEAILL